LSLSLFITNQFMLDYRYSAPLIDHEKSLT
jgi:hypothetical protein